LFEAGNDTGTLELYEGAEGRRLLGNGSGRRAVYPVSYRLELASVVPPAATTLQPQSRPPTVEAPRPAAPAPAAPAAEPSTFSRAVALEDEARELLRRERYLEGVAKAQEALALWEQDGLRRHLFAVDALNVLAMLESGRSRQAEAEAILREALAILDSDAGWAAQPLRAEVVRNLSRVQALARPSPPPAPVPPSALFARAATLDAEARRLLTDGRYAEAVPKAREALAVREEVLGPRHLDVAESLTTLGELYRAQGQYADAERLHRRALAIREAALSRDHPKVAESLNGLAMLHQAQATYKDAEAMLLRALEILEGVRATMLRNYALQAEVLDNLAKVYRALGKTAEAEEAQAKAGVLSTLR